MSCIYTVAGECCFTVVDFETTGFVEGLPAEPWQLGLVRVSQGRIDPLESFESLLYVAERPFNPMVPGRHMLLRHEIAAAPDLYELWDQLEPWLCNTPVVAHNIGTERSILEQLLPMHSIGPWVDTLKMVRHAYPDLESKALSDVIHQLGLWEYVKQLCPDREPHDALFDAFACAALLEHFLTLPGWEQVTVEALCEI